MFCDSLTQVRLGRKQTGRLVARFSAEGAAQVAIVVLWLIIVRPLAEVFRLRYVQADALTIAEVVPYVGIALVAPLVLVCALGVLFAVLPARGRRHCCNRRGPIDRQARHHRLTGPSQQSV